MIFYKRGNRSRLIAIVSLAGLIVFLNSNSAAEESRQFPVRSQVAKITIQDLASISGTDDIHEKEQAELAQMLQWCHQGKGWGIARGNNPVKENKVEDYLEKCYPIEISSSQGGRSMGHCSDFMLYVYYAGARLSDEFSTEIYQKKAKNCPKSTFLHGEFPIPALFELPVRNAWLPNAEQVTKLQDQYFWKADLILAKTMHSYYVLRKYALEKKIPVQIRHAAHSTPDPLFQMQIRNQTRNYNSFYHGQGLSGLKGTAQLMECWVQHSEWPTLTIVRQQKLEPYDELMKGIVSNIAIYNQELSIANVRDLQFLSGIHMCPSIREGFGHYINEARALGAVIITNDFGPMNEFVTQDSGILIETTDINRDKGQLLYPVEVSNNPEFICAAVEKALRLPEEKLISMSLEARRLYLDDYQKMKVSMAALKREAQLRLGAKV
jgi:glycosyltransferase involved in cell wall biosynthesis